jgi:hypothetical protein
VSCEYGLYCEQCHQATHCDVYWPNPLLEVIEHREIIVALYNAVSDISLVLTGWNGSSPSPMDFAAKHVGHPLRVWDEYGHLINSDGSVDVGHDVADDLHILDERDD